MSPSSSSSSPAWHKALNTFCTTGAEAERGWQSRAVADSGQAPGTGAAWASCVGHGAWGHDHGKRLSGTRMPTDRISSKRQELKKHLQAQQAAPAWKEGGR